MKHFVDFVLSRWEENLVVGTVAALGIFILVVGFLGECIIAIIKAVRE